MPARLELVRAWLVKARNDLEAAQRLLNGDRPILHTGCFHCQQVIEKSLRSLLILHEIKPPRTRALGELFKLCDPLCEGLAALAAQCEWLSGCAGDPRYPDLRFEVTPEKAQVALTAADALFAFVVAHVPDEVHP